MIKRIKSFCQDTGAKLDAMPSQVTVTAKVRLHLLTFVV